MNPAKKSLGQNFLIDGNIIGKIVRWVKTCDPKELLEIGPGRGALTEKLVELGIPLTLIEKDHALAKEHAERWKENESVNVVDGDFLNNSPHPPLTLRGGAPEGRGGVTPITVVGNLPYNVASPIFIKLLKNHAQFSDLFLMFQKEVGMRLVAEPGTKDYSLLTLWANAYTDVVDWFDIPPTVFRPQPKIWSRLIHFKIKQEPLIADNAAEDFFAWVAKLFQQRRKTMGAVLKLESHIWDSIESKLGIPKSQRAEKLMLKQLLDLHALVLSNSKKDAT